MANPYQAYTKRRKAAVGTYGPGPQETGIQPFSLTPDRTAQDEAQEGLRKAQEDAAWAQSIGSVAGGALGAGAGALLGSMVPGVGTVYGGLAGAGLGSQLGSAAGGMFGESGVSKAEAKADKERRKAMEQQALMEAIMSLRGV